MAEQDIEFMRYLPMRDGEGAADAGSAGAAVQAAPVQRGDWAQPESVANVPAAEIAARERALSVKRSFADAAKSGVGNTIYAGLYRTFTKPVFSPDPTDSFEKAAQDVVQADIALTDARSEALYKAVSPAERQYLLGMYKEQDRLAQSAATHQLTALGVGMFDVDLAVPLVGKAASVGLRAGSLTTKALGAARVSEALAKAGKTAGAGANTLFGDISAVRSTNALANLGMGLGVIGLADAVSDEEVGWEAYAMAGGLGFAAGWAFPAAKVPKAATATATAPRASSIASELEVPAVGKALDAELKAPAEALDAGRFEYDAAFMQDFNNAFRATQGLPLDPAKVDPAKLAALTPSELAAYGLRQMRDRVERVHMGWRESEYWAKLGAADSSMFHVHAPKAKAGITPDAELVASEVQELWSKFMPGVRLEIEVADEVAGKATANGSFAWTGESTARIALKSSLIEGDVARAMGTAVHEVGHGITMRMLTQALKNDDYGLLKAYWTAFKRHTGKVADDVSGSVVASDLGVMPSAAKGGDAGALALRSVNPDTPLGLAELRKYYESPLEWLAQQFVKDAQQVVREAKIGVGSAREAAQNSALYRAMPEAVQGFMWDLIDRIRNLWSWWFEKNKHMAEPELSEVFENIARNPKRMDNYSNWERTAASTNSDGLGLEPWAASPSARHYTAEELSQDPLPAGAVATDGAARVASGPPIPYGPQPLSTPNQPAMLRWFEDRFGKGWYSVFENLNHRGGYLSGLASMLVHNGAGKHAGSAAAFKRAAELELSAARAQFDNALAEATRVGMFGRFTQSKKFRERYRALGVAVREDLMRKFNAYADGKAIPVNPDPQVEELSQLYAKTGYAKKSLHFQKTAGRYGSELISENPWYVPMRMNSDSFRDVIRAGRATEADIKGLLRTQLSGMFPGMDEAYLSKVSAGVYDGVMQRGMGRASKKPFFEGTTLDELQQAMISADMDPTEVAGFLEKFKTKAAERSKDTTLRARLEWDWDLEYATDKGTVSMRDLVDPDLVKSLEGHQRTVSGQYGLGMVGFKSDSELRSAIDKALDDYSANGATDADLQYTRELLDNVVDSLLGRRVGEPVPPLMRATATMSQALVLKNTAYYMAVESTYAMNKLGAARFIKNLVQPSGMLDGLKGLDKASAGELQKVLEGRFVAEGRWHPILTYLDDGYELHSSLEAFAIHTGALSRILTGGEHLRRKLCKTVLGAGIADLYKAARGGEVEGQLMARYGATPELLARIRKELDKAPDGHELAWDPRTRAETEVVLMNLVDQIVQANRLGEVPAFMQFSTLGKALFPFTQFIAGSYNKVFLKNLQDEEGAGLAVMLMWQIAGGAMAEGLINVTHGRAPTDSGERSFLSRSVTNSNVASWFGVALESATSPYSSGAVQFAFPEAVRDIFREKSLNSVVGATVLSVNPAVRVLENLADD